MRSVVPFELTTERRRLRDYVLSDVEAIQRFAGDPAVVEHLPFGPNGREETEALIRLDEKREPQLAV